MGVCVVGGGLSGLAAAARVKIDRPDLDVLLVQKPAAAGNTLIAGQRYRTRGELPAGPGSDPHGLHAALIARNGGEIDLNMESFAFRSVSALNFWLAAHELRQLPDQPPLKYSEEVLSFGPRLGDPASAAQRAGRYVLQWFRELAKRLRVRFFPAEVTRLVLDGDRIHELAAERRAASGEREGAFKIEADQYVLAAGNPAGSLFDSTNVPCRGSAVELAFAAGLPISDVTTHLLHPFARVSCKGRAAAGCLSTDDLDRVEVGFENGALDRRTTELLRDHRAHYHFPEIAQRFIEQHSPVVLRYADGRRMRCGVAHHCSQMGIQTADGVAIEGLTNAFAVGDASSIGHWTAHRPRLPGTALTKCLLDAELVNERLAGAPPGKCAAIEPSAQLHPARDLTEPESGELRSLNTSFLLECMMDGGPEAARGAGWRRALERTGIPRDIPLMELSLALAEAMGAPGPGGGAVVRREGGRRI